MTVAARAPTWNIFYMTLTDLELQTVLHAESERVEWKQSAKDTVKIGRAICALANDLGATHQPGYVVIGIKDDGQLIGAFQEDANTDQEQQSLVSRLSSSQLVPTPSFNVEVVSAQGHRLLVIVVYPYLVPPVVTFDGDVLVRRGPSTIRASHADRQRLQERRPLNTLSFDLRPFSAAALDDLELAPLTLRYEQEKNVEEEAVCPELCAWLTQHELGRMTADHWSPNPSLSRS